MIQRLAMMVCLGLSTLPGAVVSRSASAGEGQSRSDAMLESLASSDLGRRAEAVRYFGTELGVPALDVLAESMKDSSLRHDIREIRELVGPQAIDPLLAILHEDALARAFPGAMADLPLMELDDIHALGDRAGLARAGTVAECLAVTLDAGRVEALVDLALHEPVPPEYPYLHFILRKIRPVSPAGDARWQGVVAAFRAAIPGPADRNASTRLAEVSRWDIRPIDEVTGDLRPDELSALADRSDPASRLLYLNALAFEHNESLLAPAIERFAADAGARPEDPLASLSVGALQVIQRMGEDPERTAEAWLDRSRESYLERAHELRWSSFERIAYLEAAAHYYGGLLSWWAVLRQDMDRVDQLANRQRELLLPAEDLLAAVRAAANGARAPAGAEAATTADTVDVRDYVPLDQGRWWKYSLTKEITHLTSCKTHGERITGIHYERIDGPSELIDRDVQAIRLLAKVNETHIDRGGMRNREKLVSHVTVDEHALRMYAQEMEGQLSTEEPLRFDPPVSLVQVPLPDPAEPNPSRIDILGMILDARPVELAFEDVDVPAGRFVGCLKLRSEGPVSGTLPGIEGGTIRGGSLEETAWFAPGVGLVQLTARLEVEVESSEGAVVTSTVDRTRILESWGEGD